MTVSESGGVAEFVLDNENGLIAPPDPKAIAAAFDLLYMNRTLAKRLGEQARGHVETLASGGMA
jgi:glycosyltransferase involved in cell wall biosynthesis